jgi:DNA repair protein SbcC/Rad50
MRPVRLAMQAFGPYPTRQTLDFREAVAAGLFGIYGQTGSGKSTIFSAMTFALFGEPAKSEQDAASLRSDLAYSGTQTEVEFVFDIGERRFVILRHPEQTRPSKRGEGETRTPHIAFLFEATGLAVEDIKEGQRGKIIVEKKVREVDAEIVKLLGYGPEQFRQIGLLPQGKFETFLAAKTPDRLKILRELFDVSLYRDLAAWLKADAETVERQVSQERELCARRLATEGFESSEAMAISIAEAETSLQERIGEEAERRAVLSAAQTALQGAKAVEARFAVAEQAQKELSVLHAGKDSMDALSERVMRAEKARTLLDTEYNVIQATDESRAAEATLGEAQKSEAAAEQKAGSTAAALKAEADRAGEIDQLRQQIDTCERSQQTLEKATGGAATLEAARSAERKAHEALKTAGEKLSRLQNKEREQAEAYRLARSAEEQRLSFQARLNGLTSSFFAAETFEKAQTAVDQAEQAVRSVSVAHENALALAEAARQGAKDAERRLSEAQALHLAAKLMPGEPCPVCGALDHPALATGSLEHAGRDQAFRDANIRWKSATDALGKAENALTGNRSVLLERQRHLDALELPVFSIAAIQTEITAAKEALGKLPPSIDMAKTEAEIEHLKTEIEAGRKHTEALRDAFVETQKEATSAKARLDEMLSFIPEPLRDPVALAAAREKAQHLLNARRDVMAQAELAATKARETALAAAKDQEAAEIALQTCRKRHTMALDTFNLRLEQVGLSSEAFQSLKPTIATIDADRAQLEEHRRKLEIAESTARTSADGIMDQIRPDLQDIESKLTETERKFTEATNQRARAAHRLEHLTKLRDELAETLRKLDEVEATSGPLRKLALLANGNNAQSLNLETFAIGAMFDQVLDAANQQLSPMTSHRYRLERDLEGGGRGRRGLGIQVFDIHTGKPRSTATLSGGETFIAALALALGLASVVENASGKVRLDTIFIDEGFGSLDTENGAGTLDQVLQALSSLASQNRAVGVISHVPLVQEAIPNGFYVRKHAAGSSVETRGDM